MSETDSIDVSILGAWGVRDGVILRGDVVARRMEVARRQDGRVAMMERRGGAVAWDVILPADVALALSGALAEAAAGVGAEHGGTIAAASPSVIWNPST